MTLIERLHDEREMAKDLSRLDGNPSAWDPMTAQQVANTMFEAAERIGELEEALERIANFAPGYGEAAERIAQMARYALFPELKPPLPPEAE